MAVKIVIDNAPLEGDALLKHILRVADMVMERAESAHQHLGGLNRDDPGYNGALIEARWEHHNAVDMLQRLLGLVNSD